MKISATSDLCTDLVGEEIEIWRVARIQRADYVLSKGYSENVAVPEELRYRGVVRAMWQNQYGILLLLERRGPTSDSLNPGDIGVVTLDDGGATSFIRIVKPAPPDVTDYEKVGDGIAREEDRIAACIAEWLRMRAPRMRPGAARDSIAQAATAIERGDWRKP